jgi:Holliday junction resolvase
MYQETSAEPVVVVDHPIVSAEEFLPVPEYLCEAEAKAERCLRADRQEQACVVNEKAKGNLAYRIDKEFDVLILEKSGKHWLVDCKFTDDIEFWIEKSDVNKLLNEARKFQKHGVDTAAKIDMHFPRWKSRNHRYIVITEADRDWSIRVTKSAEGMTVNRVRR